MKKTRDISASQEVLALVLCCWQSGAERGGDNAIICKKQTYGLSRQASVLGLSGDLLYRREHVCFRELSGSLCCEFMRQVRAPRSVRARTRAASSPPLRTRTSANACKSRSPQQRAVWYERSGMPPHLSKTLESGKANRWRPQRRNGIIVSWIETTKESDP